LIWFSGLGSFLGAGSCIRCGGGGSGCCGGRGGGLNLLTAC
jgi:hypothetical protein